MASLTSPPTLWGTCRDSLLLGGLGSGVCVVVSVLIIPILGVGAGHDCGDAVIAEVGVIIFDGIPTGIAEVVLNVVGLSDGKADNDPSFEGRLMGGRPRVFPVPPGPPLLHAEDTTLAPCLLLIFGFCGVIADLGSVGSVQKAFLFDGVIADWG